MEHQSQKSIETETSSTIKTIFVKSENDLKHNDEGQTLDGSERLVEVAPQEGFEECWVTDPQHGGKVDCDKCSSFIDMGKGYAFKECEPFGHRIYFCAVHSPIQDKCVYGYVLPDRCRYWNNQGCKCGAYPPIKPIKES